MSASCPPLSRRAAPLVVALIALGAGARVVMPAEAAAGNPIAEAFPLIFDAEWVRLDVEGDSLEVRGTFLVIRAAYARYILTTARLWGRPLRYASFEVRLPAGVETLEFSYPFERRVVQGETCYVYETERFFPDRDIVVRWQH